jgi:hypothetical protein
VHVAIGANRSDLAWSAGADCAWAAVGDAGGPTGRPVVRKPALWNRSLRSDDYCCRRFWPVGASTLTTALIAGEFGFCHYRSYARIDSDCLCAMRWVANPRPTDLNYRRLRFNQSGQPVSGLDRYGPCWRRRVQEPIAVVKSPFNEEYGAAVRHRVAGTALLPIADMAEI